MSDEAQGPSVMCNELTCLWGALDLALFSGSQPRRLSHPTNVPAPGFLLWVLVGFVGLFWLKSTLTSPRSIFICGNARAIHFLSAQLE